MDTKARKDDDLSLFCRVQNTKGQKTSVNRILYLKILSWCLLAFQETLPRILKNKTEKKGKYLTIEVEFQLIGKYIGQWDIELWSDMLYNAPKATRY